MNRIILIGNGLDIAHGLKTQYSEFINWYWNCWIGILKQSNEYEIKDDLCKFEIRNNKTWGEFFRNEEKSLNESRGVDFLNEIKFNYPISAYCSSCVLLEKICVEIEKRNWVDIEDIYYSLLKKCTKANTSYDIKVEELNNHLDFLRNKLIQYLRELPEVEKICGIYDKIYEPISKNDVSNEGQQKLQEHIEFWLKCSDVEWEQRYKQYKYSNINHPILKDLVNDTRDNYSKQKDYIHYFNQCEEAFLWPDNIMLLNFNYTKTPELYKNDPVINFEIVNIHGQIDNAGSVIFGNGDELDDEYKMLQNLNDNRYLDNIKSIKYLEADNYRKMLSFIDSAPFQIYIMGHSCGISDRTLLNTLFEHKNCISIKPFYYKKEDESDNYLEIIQNISRNFTDMKLMRDRVVNKVYCEPLPQAMNKSTLSSIELDSLTNH